MPVNAYREYDLLSNKYKENHEEKVKLDNEIQNLQSAKKFWERNEYNPILVKFNDADKEAEYQTKKNQENQALANNSNKILNRNARG